MILLIIIALLWIVISTLALDIINSAFQKWLTARSKMSVLKTGKNIVKSILLVLVFTISVLLTYLMCLTNYTESEYFILKIVNSFPFLKQLYTGEKIVGMFQKEQLAENTALGMLSWIGVYLIFLAVLLLLFLFKSFFFGCLIQSAAITGLFILIQTSGISLNVDANFEVILFTTIGIIVIGCILNFVYSLISIIMK